MYVLTMSELEKVLSGERVEETPKEPSAEPVKTDTQPEKTREEIKKEEHLANLDRAISEANEELRNKRKLAKESPAVDDDIPKIDDEDPGARAWNNRIKENVSPIQSELEKGKEEVRSYALREFLEDKPALAKSPEKVKELMSYYERIHTATETNKEGIIMDLRKAYAVVYSDEIYERARETRVNEAQAESAFSDIAISRGATSYGRRSDAPRRALSKEELEIISSWKMTPEEYLQMEKEHGQS